MTLTEFVLARKTERTEAEIISAAAVDAVEMGLSPAETMRWFNRFDRTLYAQHARANRAGRNLGWAILGGLRHPLVKREAAKWSSHPDYLPEWRP